MNAIRTLRVAGIQVESRNLDVRGNLRRAEALVAAAAERGAELVLCPELLAPGYVYDASLWGVAEPRGGPTELWLARVAAQHRLYVGASYLEASGDDFFNTFTLMRPDGTVAGRVRKASLPGFEGWYYRGCSEPKVIQTELGRVGIGICWDTSTTSFLRHVCQQQVDLLLMPHSTPRITMGTLTLLGETGRKELRGVAGFYASALGVPTVMANKAAAEDSWSPVPLMPLVRLRFHYVGQSTICNGDGNVCDQLEEQEGIVFAEVALDAERKRLPRIPAGYWSRPPAAFPRTSAALFRALEWVGKAAYKLSRSRRRAARATLAQLRTEASHLAEQAAVADGGEVDPLAFTTPQPAAERGHPAPDA
jgi:N-carbamoylputrescine amidase